MKSKYIVASVLGIVILSLAVYSTLHSVNNIIINVSDETITSGNAGISQSIGVLLEVTNERDGEIIHRVVKDDDLVLRNMAGIMHFMLKGTDVEASIAYKISNGAPVTLDLNFGGDKIESDMAKMYIGTGSTAPIVTNYKLEVPVLEDYVEGIAYQVAGLQMNASFVTTFNIDGTYALREAGLATYINGGNNPFLIFRDVYGVINVIAGDILTVRYVMMFN